MRRPAILGALLAVLIAPALTSAGPAASAIAQLEARVDNLEARVAALEAAWPTSPPTPSASATPSLPPTPSTTPSLIPTTTPSASATPSAPPASPTPVPTVSPTPTSPTPTPSASCPSLSSAINSTPVGGTLDLTGCTYGPATLGKSLTLVGASFSVPFGQTGLTVTADDVTLRDITVTGGENGIRTLDVQGFTLTDSTIQDARYAGVLVLSGSDGLIADNLIRRIGVGQPQGSNAYGVAITRTSGSQPTGYLVARNRVEQVPNWIGLDTHGGRDVTFSHNVVTGTRRAIWLVDDGQGPYRCVNCVAEYNDLSGFPSFDPSGVTTYKSDNARVQYNTIRGLVPSRAVRDLGQSTGLVNTPNTVVP